MDIPVIGITGSGEERVGPYAEAVSEAGGEPRIVPMEKAPDIHDVLNAIDGLLLSGGADIDPTYYGQQPDPSAGLEVDPTRDAHELPLVRAALERDLPVLGICRGMQVLNVVLGGSLTQHIPNHDSRADDSSAFHQVFVPPGSRLTAMLGIGGFMKVNSRHHQGFTLAQKAPELLVSAFSLNDGIIEAIDSPRHRHRWVVGVQWHPERRSEVSAQCQNLFRGLVEAARQTRTRR